MIRMTWNPPPGIRLFVKHVVRLKNTIVRRIKIVSLKLQYGKQFQAKRFHFRRGFSVFIEEDGFLEIGRNVFFNSHCSITARQKIRIGDNCIFGENVKLYDHNHNYRDNDKLICQQGFTSDEIIIEEDCWIGSNVTILKGVHIGKHSVVGAGVIVYKDLPAHSLTVCKQNICTQKI